MTKPNKKKDAFTDRPVQVKSGSYLSRRIKVGTSGIVYDWYNNPTLGGDVVLQVMFDGNDDLFECEPHEVKFMDIE